MVLTYYGNIDRGGAKVNIFIVLISYHIHCLKKSITVLFYNFKYDSQLSVVSQGLHVSSTIQFFLGHRSQRLQWPIVITRCPASVRRLSSVVCRPLDYLHFWLLLQNRLMDFDETWYGWSTQGPLQVLLFFGQIPPGADQGRGKNRSRGFPSPKNFFFRPEGYSNKPNA